MTFGKVSRMRRNFISDYPFPHIFLVGQSKMLFRRDVTEHGGAVPAYLGGADEPPRNCSLLATYLTPVVRSREASGVSDSRMPIAVPSWAARL